MAKATKTQNAYSPVKTGVDPRNGGGSGSDIGWLKIETNQILDVVSLVDVDEIITIEQCAIWLDEGNSPVWTYTGPGDPSHDLGVDRKYRAFLPVKADGEVKVWSMGKTAHVQLLDIADASGHLKGMELRLKRTGTGLGTRYSVVPRNKRVNIDDVEEVDVVSMLGPLTVEGVQEYIAKKLNKETYQDVLDSYAGKKPTKASVKKDGKAKAKPVEDDEEDLDDVELT